MTRGKRRLSPRTSNVPRLATVTAPLVTIGAIGVGVVIAGVPVTNASLGETAVGKASSSLLSGREAPISRNFNRMAIAGASNVKPPVATGKLWTTAPLDVRLTPTENAATAGVIKERTRVDVTGVRHAGYAEIVVKKRSRWVTAEYLAKKKPAPQPADIGLSNAPCADGSSIESGLQPQAVRVYRAACAAFPELSSYGGQDGHGEHVNGEAIDFMTPSHDVGERLKNFLYANRYELGLFDIIWAQQIWTIERDGEGFRSMSNRGSATANHFDHVHIKIL